MFDHGMFYSAIFWGAIVCFALIANYFRYKTRESEHRMLEKLAEKGQSISPDLLSNIGRDHEQRSGPLRAGVILMCLGVSLAVFFWAMNGGGGMFHGEHTPNWLPVVGIIPFMLGVALFLTSLFERRPPK
jgi:hypothetical protein